MYVFPNLLHVSDVIVVIKLSCSAALILNVPLLILPALMAPVQATATMSAANPPAADLGWPSLSKLASAEHDRADHGMKGDSESCALHPTALQQTEKCMCYKFSLNNFIMPLCSVGMV